MPKPILPRETVCRMGGLKRGKCWGCPHFKCDYLRQPFDDLVEDMLIARRAAELLRANRVWRLRDETNGACPGRVIYDSLHPEVLDDRTPEEVLSDATFELLARLYEHRKDFYSLQAAEGVIAGVYDLEEGSRLCKMRETASGKERSYWEFTALVKREQAAALEPDPLPGAQRHTWKCLNTDADPDGEHGNPTHTMVSLRTARRVG